MRDSELLDFARRGDQQAFADLPQPHLRELTMHCYRMLGFLFETEDALPEVRQFKRKIDGYNLENLLEIAGICCIV